MIPRFDFRIELDRARGISFRVIHDEPRAYHVDGKGGLSGYGDVETADPGPRERTTRYSRWSTKDRTGASGSLDGPTERGECGDNSSDRFDEEQPSHLSGVDHHQGKLDLSSARYLVEGYGLTRPKDKIGNHSITRNSHITRDVVL